MKNVLAGKAVAVDVLFQQGVTGDFVVPDAGSITYSLYDNTMNALVTDAAVDSTMSTTAIVIPTSAPNNTLSGGNLFEERLIVVTYTVNNVSQTQMLRYRIVPLVPYSASPDTCRRLLGLTANELPDEDVDVFAAYVNMLDLVEAATLNAALIAADSSRMSANQAIAAQAIIDILPSLQLRTLQQSKSNTAQVSRFYAMDFDALSDWIYSVRDNATNDLTDDDAVGIFGTGVIFGATTVDTDPVTGATPVAL